MVQLLVRCIANLVLNNSADTIHLIDRLLGYSIFVVRGTLPPCEAEEVLKLCPAVASPKAPNQNSSNNLVEDPELKWALENSRQMFDEDDVALRQALQISSVGEFGKV